MRTRRARVQGAPVAVAEIAEKIRSDIGTGKEFAIDTVVVEARHRPAIKSERACCHWRLSAQAWQDRRSDEAAPPAHPDRARRYACGRRQTIDRDRNRGVCPSNRTNLLHLWNEVSEQILNPVAERRRRARAARAGAARKVDGPLLMAPDDAVQVLPSATRTAIGSGAALLAEAASPRGIRIEPRLLDLEPDATALAEIAAESRETVTVLRPLYLRPPDARPQTQAELARR